MSRSIFDTAGDPERSGSMFTSPDADQESQLPEEIKNPASPDETGMVDFQPPPEKPSIDNIARFFGGKAGAMQPGIGKQGTLARPAMDIPAPSGEANLRKGQRVHHAKYGEGTILMREGDGEDAKLTVMFNRHGMKKLMEKFANLRKI